MKKIIAILLFIASFAHAQIPKIENLPTGATGYTGAYLALSNGTMYKQTVGNFLLNYVPSVFLSLTTNYVPKAASATTLSNSLIYDNGTSVSIGNASPTASTKFEVNSTTGAFLIPRMTTTQRNALTPLDGMIVHNTSLFTYDGYAAGSWYNFIGTNQTNTADYYPKFVTSTTLTNSFLKDSVDYVTTMSSGFTTRHFKYVDGNQGAAKVLTSDGSGNATWQAAAASLTGATGDLISFSATNTQSNIAAGAAGTYLRFAGASTLPIVSTLVLPNSATANRLAYATATNTWGDNSLLTFDGTIFTANGLKSNASGAYIGANVSSATVPLNIRVDQNNKTSLNITNSTAGASASARLEIFNDVGSVINFGLNSSTTTPYGMNAAGDGYIYSGRSFGLMSDVVGGVIRFAAGGSSQIAQINSSGLSIGSTAAASVTPLAIKGSSNDRISIEVQNSNSAGNSSFYFQNNRGSFATYGGLLTCGSAHALNFLGVTSADKTYLISDGASSTGLAIGTLTADPLNFGTNNTNRATISSAGLVTWSAAYHVLAAGTATAGQSPLKMQSGPLLSSPEIGAWGFLTDRLTFTTTTGTTQKDVNLLSYRGITALRTLDGSDELVNCTSGTYTVTLPTAVGYTQQYTVKNIGTGIITLATTSSQTIDGYASGVLVLNQYDSYTLRSNGADWIIIK